MARADQADGPAPTAQPAPCRHAVGTQNYSSLSSTQYGNNQGFARLFKGQTNALISIHYFNSQGQPVFNQARPLPVGIRRRAPATSHSAAARSSGPALQS